MTTRKKFMLIAIVGLTCVIAGYRIGRTELMAAGVIIFAVSGLASLIRNDQPKHQDNPKNGDHIAF